MTREYALMQLCPFSIARKPMRCVAAQCMGWRDVTLYVAYRVGEKADGEQHTMFMWQLSNSDGAHVVDCGYCGPCGLPHMQSGINAPLGYDEQSLIGLELTGKRKKFRSVNKLEKDLMRERGIILERDLTPRSYQGQYDWRKRKGKT